uniref:Protein tyrosine phosphatase receptor type N2 n=1 Tax=Oncorhynchus mykiss TaxID=8022 RepID=A0A8C7VLX3_ONCMY
MCAKLVASYPRRLEAVITGKSASTMYRVKGLNTYCVCVCSLIDRVFGRCLELPSADLYTYDVSASALQHLRTLLQKLSHRGLTWQDATTQQVISRELSKIRKVPIRRPEPPSASLTLYGGARKLKTGKGELGFQKYLQELGLLPQSVGTARQGPQRESPLTKVKITHSRSFFKHQSTLHLTSVCVCVQMCRAFNHPLFSLSSQKGSLRQIPVVKESHLESGQFMVLTIISMVLIMGALAVSGWLFCLRHRSHLQLKEKLASLGTDTSADATATYQELCRQRMAVRTSERAECPEPLRRLSRLNSSSSQFSDGGPIASPSARSSTSSWCEEPVPSNMDISTGHMILSYMEDHLKNKNRLEREWEAMCGYLAEPGDCDVGQGQHNTKRNRSDAVVVYDHSRITLKAENNHGNSDYINASPIMDHDPRNPMYIASQGPLPSTVADFWQMVWESGCVVIVMLTPLSENGVKQCQQYWPDEGSNVYHVYEVNLVSEHIWCEDFLVRSFYLKNLQTNETRTVTQFHFLSWVDHSIPDSARTLLDFRRKVNKCYRGRSCPIIVHCSDGAGRSGTYILIDMVLNRMAKGAKEIDIAATLEHLRDQRAGMVQTKEQFELALTAVAEEVNAILKALPQ